MSRENEYVEDLNTFAWEVLVQPHAGDDPRFAEAMRSARRALELEPALPYVLNTAGVAEYRAGRYEVAVRHLLASDRARAPDGCDRSVADVAFLAMCYARLGRPGEAAREVEALREVHAVAEREPVEFGLLGGEAELIAEAIAVVEGS